MNNALERPFTCAICGTTYRLRQHVVRHTKNAHSGERFLCDKCGITFARQENLRRHIMTIHAPQPTPTLQAQEIQPAGRSVCELCGRTFTRADNLRAHVRLRRCQPVKLTFQHARNIQPLSPASSVYNPLRGSSYIPLPPQIIAKRAVVNVLNVADEKCFEYALLSKFVENPTRAQLRTNKFTAEVRTRANLDFTGMQFPVKLDQIRTFERNNQGVSINVYGLDSRKKKKTKNNGATEDELIVYPLRVAEQELANHFDLLFISNQDTTHYTFIRNFDRLVSGQLSRHEHRLFICKRCFAYFDNRPTKLGLRGAERLEEHKRYCSKHAPLRTDLSDDKEIKFQHYERTQRSRFTIYADFECALVPYEAEQPIHPTPTVQPPAWDPATARRLP